MERTLAANDAAPNPVLDHYAADGLMNRLRSALTALGPEDRPLTISQLSAMDQFHTRGIEATIELARLAGLAKGMNVLDVGSGLGGPARFVAQAVGCSVTGVDSSKAFVAAADYLSERTGLGTATTFLVGDALRLPFSAGEFDAVLLQHVAMNIRDRFGLYREIRRVLKTGGQFATFDVVSRDGGAPEFPVPWSRTPEGSFLMTADETREAIERAGFRTNIFRDDSEPAKAWFTKLREAGPPPMPNLGLVMGPDIASAAGNLGASVIQGKLAILTAIFEAR
jgi:ubiquinone/menaquinone biosynthesis C-methylase UbiE